MAVVKHLVSLLILFFGGGGDFFFFFLVAAEGSLTPTNDSNDIEIAIIVVLRARGWAGVRSNNWTVYDTPQNRKIHQIVEQYIVYIYIAYSNVSRQQWGYLPVRDCGVPGVPGLGHSMAFPRLHGLIVGVLSTNLSEKRFLY